MRITNIITDTIRTVLDRDGIRPKLDDAPLR